MLHAVLLISAVLLASCRLPAVTGWGAEGHTATAFLAQSLFTPAANSLALKLLPAERGQIAPIASWADEVRERGHSPYYPWSARLHYVDTPDWLCHYSALRDCVKDECVEGAIRNYTARLLDGALSTEQRQEALEFAVHFVGDAHQPLHAGFVSDAGGNDIKVSFEGGRTSDLHAAWDTALIQRRVQLAHAGNYTAWMVDLQRAMDTTYKENATQWTACPAVRLAHLRTLPRSISAAAAAFEPCSAVWVEESAAACCSTVYLDDDGGKMSTGRTYSLTATYFERNIDLLERRLIQAAVRMAFVVNTVAAALAGESGAAAQRTSLRGGGNV